MRILVLRSLWPQLVAIALTLALPFVPRPLSTPADAARSVPPPVARYERFVGIARTIDGDTIDVGTTRVRLEGIDAPEQAQTCHRPLTGSWPCGRDATNFMRRLVDGKSVECENRGLDKYGRTLGICYLGTTDINAAMVHEGLAWAFVRYSTTYVSVEQDARIAHRGIWSADNKPAWDYRGGAWASAEPASPAGCAIKGNAGRNGLIYHMPWSPWYNKVRMPHAGSSNGKRWFCSEADAIAAGYRAAIIR